MSNGMILALIVVAVASYTLLRVYFASRERLVLGFRISERDGRGTCGTSDRVFSVGPGERCFPIRGKNVVDFAKLVRTSVRACRSLFYIHADVYEHPRVNGRIVPASGLQIELAPPAERKYVFFGPAREQREFRWRFGEHLLYEAERLFREHLAGGDTECLETMDKLATWAEEFFRVEGGEHWCQAIVLRGVAHCRAPDILGDPGRLVSFYPYDLSLLLAEIELEHTRLVATAPTSA